MAPIALERESHEQSTDIAFKGLCSVIVLVS